MLVYLGLLYKLHTTCTIHIIAHCSSWHTKNEVDKSILCLITESDIVHDIESNVEHEKMLQKMIIHKQLKVTRAP